MMKIQVVEQNNCIWCTRLHPHINKLAEDADINIEFTNISEDYSELASRWDIKTTPTVCIIEEYHNDGDQEVARFFIGPGGIAAMMSEIKQYIKEYNATDSNV